MTEKVAKIKDKEKASKEKALAQEKKKQVSVFSKGEKKTGQCLQEK